MDQPSTSIVADPTTAPERTLPSTSFYSIEYPGFVQETSVPQAIRTLGGQSCVDDAFKRTASKHGRCLELNFRPDNPFSHPVPGEIVPTTNIVLKVVRRKRKIPSSTSNDSGHIGEYTVQAVGIGRKTARFRGAVLTCLIIPLSPLHDFVFCRYGGLSIQS
jgi:general transcription factor 3C polypeptide 5 (transcription factor C subunit 1)